VRHCARFKTTKEQPGVTMQARETVRLIVPVKIPSYLNAEHLVTYLNNFILVGLHDLHESIADKTIDTDQTDKTIAYWTEWQPPELEDKSDS
jgi:hypothetical protein